MVSSGGRFIPPSTSSRMSGSTGVRARIACSTRSPSARSVTRRSTRIRASAGTTLSAVPACATVGVTVVPTSGRPSWLIASTWCDASTNALTPFSGSRPACAARPCTMSSNPPVPLRPIFSTPPGAAGSSTSTAPQAWARCSISARDAPGPDFFVGREQQLDPGPVSQRGSGMNGHHDPTFHVEDTGSADDTVDHFEGAPGQGAEREHGVVVSDDQHPGRVAAPPMDVRTRRTVDQLGLGTEPLTDERRQRPGRLGQGGDVVGRRLHLDQRAEVVEHGVDVDDGSVHDRSP